MKLKASHESSKFNFGIEISALMMSGKQKRSDLGLILKNWSYWSSKNLTEFPFEN